MRIAQVAPLRVAVPPRGYGGTERVIAELTEALIGLGHDVTLYASGDSRTSARLVPVVPRALGFGSKVDALSAHLTLLTEVYRSAGDYDVIHSHLEQLTLPFVGMASTPTVLTFHSRLDIPELLLLLRAYPRANYVSISDAQREPVPDVHWVATVYHGVNVESFPFRPEHDDYLVFVGRISPEKGPEHAIEIAKRAGSPLKIAAKVDPSDRDFFKREVLPRLDHPLIEFLGPLGERRKRVLMANARALLLPIDWPEPFGMVFIEALASGTPVLTRPRGAAPEVLRDGATGYLRETDEELAATVGKLDAIDRTACRHYAASRFDTARMARNYVEVYEQVRAARSGD